MSLRTRLLPAFALTARSHISLFFCLLGKSFGILLCRKTDLKWELGRGFAVDQVQNCVDVDVVERWRFRNCDRLATIQASGLLPGVFLPDPKCFLAVRTVEANHLRPSHGPQGAILHHAQPISKPYTDRWPARGGRGVHVRLGRRFGGAGSLAARGAGHAWRTAKATHDG
jgi:hypothetical protein